MCFSRVRPDIICTSDFQLKASLPGDLCFRRLRQMFSWRLVLANREAVAHRRAQIEAEHASSFGVCFQSFGVHFAGGGGLLVAAAVLVD